MPKQAPLALINTGLGPLCALFCLYTTQLSTVELITIMAPAPNPVGTES